MVKHVVMWTLKDISQARSLKEQIESMKGRVPSLIDVECGINFAQGDAACDLVLISTHHTRQDLEAYQADPVHGEVKKSMGEAAQTRHVVDFDMD